MKRSAIIISFMLICCLSVMYSQDKEYASKEFTLENCVNQFDSTKIEKTDAGYQYWFVDKNFLDGRTLKMSVVAPHSRTHAPHQHAEDEFFFVLEGTAQFYLNGDSVTVKPYSSFYCPSNSVHGISNPGDTTLKYLVIKKYIMNK